MRQGEHGNADQQAGPNEIRRDEKRATTGPVDQHADDQPEQQVRKPAGRVDKSNTGRTLMQRDDDQNLDRKGCHIGPEPGNRGGGPEPQETGVITKPFRLPDALHRPQPTASHPRSPPILDRTMTRFTPPPSWPPPPEGFVPPPGWRPDPSWPPAPPGWNFWQPARRAWALDRAVERIPRRGLVDPARRLPGAGAGRGAAGRRHPGRRQPAGARTGCSATSRSRSARCCTMPPR